MERLTHVQQQLFDWLVEYIRQNQHSPSIRQMMQAMNLKSPAPVQSRLDHLQKKGYIDWNPGKARTIRILHPVSQGVPIWGEIAAGYLSEPVTDGVEHLDLSGLLLQPQYFALRVTGDSMIEALITSGDVVIMKPVEDPKTLKDGTIVAAYVSGQGTTLKHYFRKGSRVTLKPANPHYDPIKLPAADVNVQGALVGVWRGYGSL
jgi:repressor LexA